MNSAKMNSALGGSTLDLLGVRENNLKSLHLSIKHDTLTVITGVSGSGKSSLAFDTIYAEGGRRYIETFSPYTRQFLDRLHRPDLDAISGVRPALALEQRNRMTSSRSTVGTITEINDYLKLVWAHAAELFCPKCSTLVRRNSPQHAAGDLLELGRKTEADLLILAFAVQCSGEATPSGLGATLSAEGFVRFLRGGSACSIEELQTEDLARQEVLVVIDRIRLGGSPEKELYERIRSSTAQAYAYGRGAAAALLQRGGRCIEQRRFSEGYSCSGCGTSFKEPRPAVFTFNSPLGACPACHGFGRILSLDPRLCVPNPAKSINEKALACWATPATAHEWRKLKAFCASAGIDTTVAWSELSPGQRNAILYGPAEKESFKGLAHWFKKLERKRHKVHVRVFLSRFRGEFECPDCGGARLRPHALDFQVSGRTLPAVWNSPVSKLVPFFEDLAARSPEDQVTDIALEEILSRLRYLVDVGLGYLTLDRQSRTLSGGEFQRVNLTSILGARLVNTVLVLDEPTIGLHARDTERLIGILKALKARGNTVVVVEHDREVIKAADEVIDLGPLAGSAGGEVVCQGSIKELKGCAASLTGKYLRDEGCEHRFARSSDGKEKRRLILRGAKRHNLRSIDIELPLAALVAVTGVSGSGKSTLLHGCLYDAYQKLKQGVPAESLWASPDSPVSGIEGLQHLDDIVLVDQEPIGKTPRSNAGTYTKAWDEIRECFAETEQAQTLGLSKSSFSFNVDGGRCPVCKGAGQLRIEMQFLADVFIPCEACGGARFQDKVLQVMLRGKTVIDFLNMTVAQTRDFLNELPEGARGRKAAALLSPLIELGLGYLRLGHPLSNLSGGEAQRLKLASYLDPGFRNKCLFILDEPTTGLHPHNIADLLTTLRKLTGRGHSLAVIEHNLDVIREADWIVDLGPGGGEEGGLVVAQGSPRHLAENPDGFPQSVTAALLAGRLAPLPCQDISRNQAPAPQRSGSIEVVGARHHNLKNISVSLPQNRLTVITGVSGSGKSTLAFDIIFAEGQRRYIDCLSPYARQFIKQLSRADVDRVNAIPPTIAISQKTAPPLGVSTVATTTEIYQYLRLLYAKVGTQHCVEHDVPITSLSKESVCAEIARRFKGKRILLYAPVISGRKGFYTELFARALRAEITEARIDGRVVKIEPEMRLERHKLHWISLAVGSLRSPAPDSPLLLEAVEQCLLLGNGAVEVFENDAWGEPALFSIARVCPECGQGYRELDPQDFSFRSARGVCGRCGGRGRISGSRGRPEEVCPDCGGARIGPIGRHVYLEGRGIHELARLNAWELLEALRKLRFARRLEPIIEPIMSELRSRLEVINSVGLGYLSLDREASSISGGEAQRLRLARALGSPLTGVCYVLDEPSIGLHPEDHGQLMETLIQLRDRGNTVLVVEHDEDTIRAADYLIDVGPRGGSDGGRIVACGSPADIEACPDSLTGAALRERTSLSPPARPRAKGRPDYLVLGGASANNLTGLEVEIPLKRLTVVCGVSGAGKSSLVHGALVPAVLEEFEGAKERERFYGKRTWTRLGGLGELERMIEIDQSPAGKTSTSTPASYLGIFDDMRRVFAALPEAKARGWNAGFFSFNTGKGRCAECAGRGAIKVPMSFLPDAVNVCEGCAGMRYNDAALEVLYQGLSLGTILNKTMLEARSIFTNHKTICRALDYVLELGLGYLTLGQPTHTLSGGETQRLKIARELGLREARNTLYILDEPTIGLHMVDVDKLQKVMQRLVTLGNTVIVIEHNLDIIAGADHIIELGPGPGQSGGKLIYSGPPEGLLKKRAKTATARALQRGAARIMPVPAPWRRPPAADAVCTGSGAAPD